ncbi:MAG: YdeI/OmpD-associated family protein [Actinomycetota bacterium]
MPATRNDLPTIFFATASAWRDWLAAEHQRTPGVWVKMAKKATGITSITHPEALEEALCYGWIDGQRLSFDDTYFLQKFVPRRPRSVWSQINIGHVQRLIDAGRMQPAGLAEIEKATADGRWDRAYQSQSNAEVPPDLQAALDADPQAAAFFATLRGNNKYAVLYRVQDAKKPETRARRIAKFVEMLARGETVHPQ